MGQLSQLVSRPVNGRGDAGAPHCWSRLGGKRFGPSKPAMNCFLAYALHCFFIFACYDFSCNGPLPFRYVVF